MVHFGDVDTVCLLDEMRVMWFLKQTQDILSEIHMLCDDFDTTISVS